VSTLVTGSRSIDTPLVVARAITDCPWDVQHIIHGDADGVDSMASTYATRMRIQETLSPIPDWVWAQVGPSAGPMRNEYMVEQADRVVAIWDGASDGTKDAMQQAASAGLPIYKVVCSVGSRGNEWTIDRSELIEGDQSSLGDFAR